MTPENLDKCRKLLLRIADDIEEVRRIASPQNDDVTRSIVVNIRDAARECAKIYGRFFEWRSVTTEANSKNIDDRTVTSHAIVRYVERIMHVDTKADRQRFEEMAEVVSREEIDRLLVQLLSARGYDIEAIRSEIANSVARGVAAGAHRVFANGVAYTLRKGRVVTVTPKRGGRCLMSGEV
jgi:hypothetical protein